VIPLKDSSRLFDSATVYGDGVSAGWWVGQKVQYPYTFASSALGERLPSRGMPFDAFGVANFPGTYQWVGGRSSFFSFFPVFRL